MQHECVEYQGYITPNGYGKRGHIYVHREAWEKVNGPIPAGLTIDHLCFNRKCIFVGHMEVVSRAENTRRGQVNRVYTQSKYCPKGHDKDETGRTKTGSCKACKNAASAAWRSKNQDRVKALAKNRAYTPEQREHRRQYLITYRNNKKMEMEA